MPKKILLVNAEYPKSHFEFLSLHPGLGYLSESLEKAGIENRIYEPALSGGYRNLRREISYFKPDLIGYSMMSLSHRYNYNIVSMIKKEFPSITIVAGGPHLSTFKKKALIDCQAIDIGVIMEGEETLLEICAQKALSEIAGIVYREENGNITQTRPRELINDLDAIPFPKYKKFNLYDYPKVIPIVTSRGCPYRCIFCPIASVAGKKFRARSASGVADEIEFWYQKGFRDFSIADDVFNFIEERVYDICDEIKRRQLLGLRICCSNGIRADRVNRDLLRRMKEVGFYCLAFGVESGSARVLEAIKKGESIEIIKQAIEEACQLGFWVELFFLIGSPGETWADVEESIKLALSYPIYNAQFYNLIPFPDTELYEWLEEKNYFLIPRPEYLDGIMHHVNKPVFRTPEFSSNERKKAFRYANNLIKQRVKKRKLKFERWLAKEKLRDYYCIKGVLAGFIALLYSRRWIAKLIKLFAP